MPLAFGWLVGWLLEQKKEAHLKTKEQMSDSDSDYYLAYSDEDDDVSFSDSDKQIGNNYVDLSAVETSTTSSYSAYSTPIRRMASLFTPAVTDGWVDDTSTDRAKWKLYDDFGAQKKSWVWKFFNRYGNNHNNTKEQNENKELCVSKLRVCLKCHALHHRTEGVDPKIWEINFGEKSTGHLTSHMQSKHEDIFALEDKLIRDKSLGKRGWDNSDSGPSAKRGTLAGHFVGMQGEISNNLLVRWLIADYLPVSTVVSKEFRAFCKSLNSKYDVLCRDTVDAIMIRMEADLKPIVREMVCDEHVALTTDNWTSSKFYC